MAELTDRNRIARELADLRDEHEALQAQHAQFTGTCTVHSADRAAQQVAADQLITRIEKIAHDLDGTNAAQIRDAITAYRTDLTRIEGL